MGRLRKAWQMTVSEWLCLLQAWALIHLVTLRLRCRPLPSLLTWCQIASSDRSRETPEPARLAWLVETASRISLGRQTCFKQGLVLLWLLRRRGLTGSLRIGIARGQDRLAAHAWVEHKGQILLGQTDVERYAPLLTLGHN